MVNHLCGPPLLYRLCTLSRTRRSVKRGFLVDCQVGNLHFPSQKASRHYYWANKSGVWTWKFEIRDSEGETPMEKQDCGYSNTNEGLCLAKMAGELEVLIRHQKGEDCQGAAPWRCFRYQDGKGWLLGRLNMEVVSSQQDPATLVQMETISHHLWRR